MSLPSKAQPAIGEKLLFNVDDIDLLVRRLAEIVCIPKSQRGSQAQDEIYSLIQLLQKKETDLKNNLKVAAEMAARQEVLDALEAEVRRRDEDVARIHTCLNDSEKMLIKAIFQANQKLKSIGQANARKLRPTDVIACAHRISASNAVAAPLSWQQGDPERPFPNDAEMRASMLAELSANRNLGQPGVVGSFPPQRSESFSQQQILRPSVPPGPGLSRPPGPGVSPRMRMPSAAGPQTQPGGTPRAPSTPGRTIQQPASVETETSLDDSVEAMSTDSSSSSSSDSPD